VGILGWIVAGLVIGALARLLLPGPDPIGCLGTIVIGVGGSFVGGLLASLIFEGDLRLRPAGLIGSVLGAMLLLLVRRALVGGRRPYR
jgi:uncharacterized membrane protein YeaQ/YmgE (transglycosylase-associated protein family)